MAPSISVIVRTLGRPSLTAAIASVVAQEREDIELLVVDARGDLSPPDTGTLPLRIVTSGGRLQRSAAAAMGLAAVQTRWAIFLDDDDVMLPGHLSRLAAALDSAGDAVLAHADVELIRSGPAGEERSVFDQPFEPWELLLGNRMPIHAALFDARLALAHGATFDTNLDVYEDWDFWLQMRMLGRFVHVPGVSARYMVSESSSAVHSTAFGAEAYWRIWRKWWHKAPPAWWADALRAGADATTLRLQLQATTQDSLQRMDQLQAQHKLIVQANADLADARQRLQDIQQQLAAKTHQLEQVQGSLAWTQGVLEATRADLQSTHATLAQRSSELWQSDQALVASRIETRRIAGELQAVLQSTSWRLTSGLRHAGDMVRRVRQRIARIRRGASWRRIASLGNDPYQAWIAGAEAQDLALRASTVPASASASAITVSVLMPVYNPDLEFLDAAIASVIAQSWPHWQLCIADDASTNPGVRERLRDWAARDSRINVVERASNGHISACSNSALSIATGEWIALLDQDDTLAPVALAEVVDAIARFPDAAIVYSDEDKLDAHGRRFEPYFKPAFSIELLRGQNVISHLGAYRRDLVDEVGAFREGYEGSQDHDLALRCAERLQARQIIHVPRVLYHWRVSALSTAGGGQSKPYAAEAGLRAVADSLSRTEPGAQVDAIAGLPYFRVRYPVPRPAPRVDAIVAGDPAAAGWQAALIAATAYPNLQITVIESETGSPARSPVSALRRGALNVQGPLVLALRRGLVPRSAEWLDELVSHAQRAGVGVVGGRIESASGQLAEGGLIGGHGHAFRGTKAGKGGHFGRAMLAQAFSAVAPSCMLFRRELLPLWQGIEADSDDQAAMLFCARVRQAGWRIVWTPFGAMTDAGATLVDERGAAPASPDDPAFNPNLSLDAPGFVVAAASRQIQARGGI